MVGKHHRARKHERGASHAPRATEADAPDIAGAPEVSRAEPDSVGSRAVRRSPRPETAHAPRTAATGQGSRATRLTSSAVHRSAASLVDRLTWERLVADESERQRRYGRPSAILLADVDGLPSAIAEAGPQVVERVVPPCGKTLASIARGSDRITRLSAGRFGILLREADADGAGHYADRARTACDGWLAAMPWPLRLDLHWASPEGSEDLVGALRRAERDLARRGPVPAEAP